MHKRPVVLFCSFLLLQVPPNPAGFAQSPQQVPETKEQQPVRTPEQSAEKTAEPAVKQPLVFGLEDGTPVKLRLTRNLSSADAKTGDTVDFEVLEDVKVKETILIPRGGIAWATVTDAQPKRRMGRGGKLDVNIDNVRLVDGERVPLRAVKDAKGGSHTGAMTGAIVATAIVFFPAAPLFLFMKGKDITIPKGTEITAYVNGDIPLDAAKFQPQTALAAASSAGPQNASALDAAVASLDLHSDPDGAEITIDDKYMGNTPSTLKLTPGDHKIRLEKSGCRPWEKTLTVSAGASVTLNPTLVRE